MGPRDLEEQERTVRIWAEAASLEGDLTIPAGAGGIVLFAHGSGSGRFSPRNRAVARALNEGKLGTLLLDLLTPEEEAIDRQTAHLRFDIRRLSERLVEATHWLRSDAETRELAIGFFGASTGAGAALVAAAKHPDAVSAVVSRGGRPDLAGPALSRVRAPTLLIVGSRDPTVLALNEEAFAMLPREKRLEVIPGASHLFEEPGALEQVAALARAWFVRYLSEETRMNRLRETPRGQGRPRR